MSTSVTADIAADAALPTNSANEPRVESSAIPMSDNASRFRDVSQTIFKQPTRDDEPAAATPCDGLTGVRKGTAGMVFEETTVLAGILLAPSDGNVIEGERGPLRHNRLTC